MPKTPCEFWPPKSFSGTWEKVHLLLRGSWGPGLCHLLGTCVEGTSVCTDGTEVSVLVPSTAGIIVSLGW